MPRVATCSSSCATDPGSRSDVPSWATISGNELLESGQLEDGTFRYVIRKA